MLSNRILAFAAAAFVLASAACGGGSSSSSSSQSGSGATAQGTVVAVAAGEFYFKLDRTSVPAGKVTFVVKNEGKVGHEMVVAMGEIGEDELEVGMTGNLNLDLQPGHYAIICNLPGHYKGGMYADLTVT